MERVVLLDESGEDIGSAEKSTVHTDKTPLHLAFSCYVFDAAGRFLVSRRALTKKTWPGVWTNSFCGHPLPGEKLHDAVRRRAVDELGLGLGDVRLVLPRFRYRAEMDGVVENEMCPVFIATAGSALVINPAEVEEARWVEWDHFAESVDSATPRLSPWSRLQIQQLTWLGSRVNDWSEAQTGDLPPAARAAYAVG